MPHTQIKAQIVADSVNPDEDRLTSYLLTFPRFILAELNTHRALSRNTASSRAVPVAKLVEQVTSDRVTPARFGAAARGMQDGGELAEVDRDAAACVWAAAADDAVGRADRLLEIGVHKQVANRLLEPFAWTTALVSGTDWANFFALRVNTAAQPEMQRLAHLMLRAYLSSRPTSRDWGEWHVPFADRMPATASHTERMAVAVARAARVSYTTHDVDHTLADDLALYDRLATAGHWSPFEQVAQARPGRHANFTGWRQLRADAEPVRGPVDLHALLASYEAEIGVQATAGEVAA